MSKGWIISLSIIGYIVFSLVLQAIFDFVKLEFCRSRAKNKTDEFVANLRYFVILSGLQGAGKSTLGSGIANVQTKIFQNLVNSKIEEIRLKLFDFDFTDVDIVCSEAFKLKKYNTDYIIIALFSSYPKVKTYFKGTYYDDGINYVSKLELLRDYIDAYIAFLRGNYVYFINSEFYSRVTKKYAMPLDHDSVAIKDRYINKDYNLYRYTTIFEDETLLGDGNNQGWQNEAKSDPGVDAFLRIIRHIGKSNIKYLVCAQNFNRISKDRRELATDILDVRRRKEVKCHSLQCWWYYMKISVLNYIELLFKDSLPNVYQSLSKKKNFIRATFAHAMQRYEFYEGSDYLRFSGIYYQCEEDYRKKDSNSLFPIETFSLYFPKVFCWGSLNTYEYSAVHDVLSFESKDSAKSIDINPIPSPLIREEYAKGILQKRNTRIGSSADNCYSSVDPPLLE